MDVGGVCNGCARCVALRVGLEAFAAGVVTPPMAFTCLGLLLGATGLIVLED